MARLVRLTPRLAPMPPRVARPAKVADPFYLSADWNALRLRRMRDPDFAEAKARAKKGERLVLDHKVERRDGGADLDPANTEWLTFSEHQAKTARAKAERAERQGGGRKFTRPSPP